MHAFDELYYKYNNAVFANIFKLVQHQEAAEDILQEVFATLWENRSKIDQTKSVAGWLFVISYNKSINFLQKAVREKLWYCGELPVEIAEHPESDHSQLEYQFSLINAAIENLPTQKKLVFTLCRLEGKTYEETAQLLGISAGTVKEYLNSASKFIKAYALHKYALNSLSLYFLSIFLN